MDTVEVITQGLKECHNSRERHGMLIAYAAEFGQEQTKKAAQSIGLEIEFVAAMRDKEESLKHGNIQNQIQRIRNR